VALARLVRLAKSGWYGLWNRCLRLSEEYQHRCTNQGKGKLKLMYGDFGNVVKLPSPHGHSCESLLVTGAEFDLECCRRQLSQYQASY
jgi:hypothetical protein